MLTLKRNKTKHIYSLVKVNLLHGIAGELALYTYSIYIFILWISISFLLLLLLLLLPYRVGLRWGKIFQLFKTKQIRVLMVGLDAAGLDGYKYISKYKYKYHPQRICIKDGCLSLCNNNYITGKTTIMYKCKFGEITTTIPVLGFNVETVENKSVSVGKYSILDVYLNIYMQKG